MPRPPGENEGSQTYVLEQPASTGIALVVRMSFLLASAKISELFLHWTRSFSIQLCRSGSMASAMRSPAHRLEHTRSRRLLTQGYKKVLWTRHKSPQCSNCKGK